jgi:cell division protease FtsH
MARICAPVVKRPSLAPYNGFGKRTPSDQPPVLTPSERASQNGDGAHAHGGATPVGDVGAPAPR